MDYVIIGNSAAGIAASETLSGIDPGARVCLVDQDPAGAYARCRIPEVVAKKSDLSGILYRNPDYYQARGIKLVYDRVVSIHPQQHLVRLAGGGELGYHRLLLATGARPVKPDVDGMNLQGVFTLRTYADAAGLARLAETSHRAVVLGGGLVGIKGALALRAAGVSRVTLLVKSNHPLSRQLPRDAAVLLEQELNLAGVTVKRGANPVAFRAVGDRVSKVVLDDGRELMADIVLVAKGVQPCVELLRDAGGMVDRGITVNDYLQTTLPDIYAAGDCIEVTDAVTGLKTPAGLWPLAVEQGRCAARNMAGRRQKYPPPLAYMNAVRFGDLSLVTVGRPDHTGDQLYTYGPRERVYRRLVFKDGRLVSAVFTGRVERAGLYAWLIRSGRRVNPLLRSKLVDGSATAADLMFHSLKQGGEAL